MSLPSTAPGTPSTNGSPGLRADASTVWRRWCSSVGLRRLVDLDPKAVGVDGVENGAERLGPHRGRKARGGESLGEALERFAGLEREVDRAGLPVERPVLPFVMERHDAAR